MSRVSVLGSGAWGTTLAQVLADAGQEVLVWGRNVSVVAEINNDHTNHSFLPGAQLPSSIRATTNVAEVFEFGDALVLAIPAQSLRENLLAWKDIFPLDKPIISTLKGIEAQTHSRMTEIVIEELGSGNEQIGVIPAASLAAEMFLRQPAGAGAASVKAGMSALIINIAPTPDFRIYP